MDFNNCDLKLLKSTWNDASVETLGTASWTILVITTTATTLGLSEVGTAFSATLGLVWDQGATRTPLLWQDALGSSGRLTGGCTFDHGFLAALARHACPPDALAARLVAVVAGLLELALAGALLVDTGRSAELEGLAVLLAAMGLGDLQLQLGLELLDGVGRVPDEAAVGVSGAQVDLADGAADLGGAAADGAQTAGHRLLAPHVSKLAGTAAGLVEGLLDVGRGVPLARGVVIDVIGHRNRDGYDAHAHANAQATPNAHSNSERNGA